MSLFGFWSLELGVFSVTLAPMSHTLQNIKVSRDEKTWEVEIKAEIPAEVLAKHRDAALKEMQKTAKLDGFRPGHAPIERIIQMYGEGAIMREAANTAVQHELPELLAAEKLLIIESPKVTIESLEQGKPLSFTARAPMVPQVTLPDYKKIAAKYPAEDASSFEVSDQEHQDAVTHLRRERARIEKVETGMEPKKAAEEAQAAEAKDLPELDDDFSKSIGYESSAHFLDTLKLNMKEEKARTSIEKRRAGILEELVKEAKVHYPASLREYELDEMEARMKDDLQRMGTTFEAYLAQTKKTREEIRSQWQDSADKRVRIRLILSEIARKESIEPAKDIVDHELEHLKQHHPQADDGAMRAHITHALRNELTLRSLTGESMDLSHHH